MTVMKPAPAPPPSMAGAGRGRSSAAATCPLHLYMINKGGAQGPGIENAPIAGAFWPRPPPLPRRGGRPREEWGTWRAAAAVAQAVAVAQTGVGARERLEGSPGEPWRSFVWAGLAIRNWTASSFLDLSVYFGLVYDSARCIFFGQ
jgi:hypothetical protein